MTLGLDNVEVASERLAAHRPPHRYSTVISRATLSIVDLVAGARPLLDTPGTHRRDEGAASRGRARCARP